jgi:hypothetical protein
MTLKPVVVIPPRSPLLEAVGLAVLWGAADMVGTRPSPLVIGDIPLHLPPVEEAPLVFLGWRSDLEESRRFASETLAALTSSASPLRRVALFEVASRDASTDALDSLSTGPLPDLSSGSVVAPPERFLLDHGTGGDAAGLLEIARARRWAAHTYLRWATSSSQEPPGGRRQNDSSAEERTAPWCGAME